MFPQPTERRHTAELRVPLAGVKGAETIETLGDRVNYFPVEIAIRYEFAERRVGGERETATRETWKVTARTHLLPGKGGLVEIRKDDYKGTRGEDWTPDWVRALIQHYRPAF